jgi:hypothetical protein
MTDNALDDLQAIAVRLVPNAWLKLDRISFKTYFGIALDEDTEAAHAAAAGRNRLAMRFDERLLVVEFSPSSIERGADA